MWGGGADHIRKKGKRERWKQLIEMERRYGNKDREAKSPVRVRTHRRQRRGGRRSHSSTRVCTVTPVCSLLLSLTFIYKRVYIDPLTLETQVNSHVHTHTHKHTRTQGRERASMGTATWGPGWSLPGTEDQRHREPEDREERERGRERRDKDESESWSQTESRDGSEGKRQPEPGSNYGRAGRSRGQPV